MNTWKLSKNRDCLIATGPGNIYSYNNYNIHLITHSKFPSDSELANQLITKINQSPIKQILEKYSLPEILDHVEFLNHITKQIITSRISS